MGLRIKIPLPVFILLVILLSSGVGKGLRDGVNSVPALHKDVVRVSSRKLLMVDSMLDYDDAGANTKHDPRKGKPGGKNR